MASVAVSSVTNMLGGLLTQEALVFYKVEDDVKWIREELESMQCFLKDADSKQRDDVNVKNWVEQIRRVSYDAEDVIETFIYSQNGLRRRRGLAKWVAIGKLLSELRTQYTVGKKIEKIKQRIINIKKRREEYGISKINEGSSSRQSLEEGRRFSALLDEPEVVGQQEEISTLKKQLINGEQRRCVISIFGMGGSGKTTLARKVYHDVKNDFDCHAFICLSQQYKLKDVLIRLIKDARVENQGKIEDLTTEELGTMLRDNLKEKRYLVVLDDIWSKEAWNMLGLVLPNGKNQSRVILTTRIKDVAVHADPVSHLHEMRLLNENEGWELFMKKVFPGENPSAACPSELEETGRKIVQKCGGLPLAVLVAGGLLKGKEKTFHEWHNVLQSVSRHPTKSVETCMEILALSYWDLPSYLKPCFLYFGLFPEDYEIGSGRLIRLWIAEGFIQHRDNEIMEDVAEGYLEELVGRSMIQASSKKSNGSVGKCRIHHLLRELSISIARENNFFTIHNDNDLDSSSAEVRRLALHRCSNGDEIISRSSETLRSAFYFGESGEQLYKLPDTGCELLRVIDSADFQHRLSQFPKLPKEVGEFVHLRYLAYCAGSIEDLPSNKLSKLQTLRLSGSVEILPNAIWECEQLRYLHAVGATSEHAQLNNLKNLQTLCLKAGNWIEDGLGKLTNLRKLVIYGYDKSSYHKALLDSVDKLRELRSLEITIGSHRNSILVLFLKWDCVLPFMTFKHHLNLYKMSLCMRMEQLPELPPYIAQLSLTRSELEQDAISTLEKLPCLKILKLNYNSYRSKKMICSLGGFPRLELLALVQLENLKKLIVEEGAMMNIKSVELNDTNLKEEYLPLRVLRRLLHVSTEYEAETESDTESVETVIWNREVAAQMSSYLAMG